MRGGTIVQQDAVEPFLFLPGIGDKVRSSLADDTPVVHLVFAGLVIPQDSFAFVHSLNVQLELKF